MRSHRSKRRAVRSSASCEGFTLVELLVVITIIGILAGLLITAAAGALGSAKETQIALEISVVAQAIEQYKNDVSGGAYPPDAMTGDLATSVADENAVRSAIVNDFKRHFSRAFPRHREPEALIRGLIGVGTGVDATNPNLPGGMTPAEALVFWMQEFSSDPQYPISGSGGPSFDRTGTEDLSARNWLSGLEVTRLGPRNDNKTFSGRSMIYDIDLNGDGDEVDPGERRSISFWRYFPPNSPQPLAYFDASRGLRQDFYHNNFPYVVPLKRVKDGANVSTGASSTSFEYVDLELVNEGKFQILHCGLDEEWGDFSTLDFPVKDINTGKGTGNSPAKEDADDVVTALVYPDGPFTLELADTIVNFSDKATLEDNQP